MRYKVCKIDMAPIYRGLLVDFHMKQIPQIMVFKTLETHGKIMRYVFEDGRSIVYLKDHQGMFQTLVSELKKPKAPTRPAQEYMQHPLSDRNFALLATVCVLISEMLGIECPQLEIRSNGDIYGTSIAEINLIIITVENDSDDQVIGSIRYMAHEIRHLWQYINRPEYFANSNLFDRTLDEYLMSEEENDAEAFANKFFYELTGVDTIASSPGYASGNKEIIKKIRELEKDIELDMGRIHILKKLLGFE